MGMTAKQIAGLIDVIRENLPGKTLEQAQEQIEQLLELIKINGGASAQKNKDVVTAYQKLIAAYEAKQKAEAAAPAKMRSQVAALQADVPAVKDAQLGAVDKFNKQAKAKQGGFGRLFCCFRPQGDAEKTALLNGPTN